MKHLSLNGYVIEVTTIEEGACLMEVQFKYFVRSLY